MQQKTAPFMTTSICVLAFLMFPFVPSYPEDLVPIYIVSGLIGAIGLAYARTRSQRIMTFLATMTSLILALTLWSAGVSHLQSRVQAWKNTALTNSLATSRPSTSRASTNP